MSKPKVKEIQAQYANKSAAEIASDISRYEEYLANEQRYLNEQVAELAALTPDHKRYISTLKDLTDGLKRSASDIEYDDALLDILRPMLTTQRLREKNTYNYKQFIDLNRAGLQPLIDAVAELEATTDWSKTDLTADQIHQIHTLMFEETICMLMGHLTRIDRCSIDYNNGKGFDGRFIGDKDIRIQTVGVGGYNIVRFHYRTNIY